MISCLSWVPKGAARRKPVRFEFSAEEYAKVQYYASLESEGKTAEEVLAEKKAIGEADDDELPPELRMEEYDNEEDGVLFSRDDLGGIEDEDSEDGMTLMEQGNSALAVDDDSEYDDGVDDDEDDAGDDEILPTDSLILTAVTEDEFSHIEVQVLSEDGSLYLHHDITLPDFPLCMAWLDCPPFLQNSLSESGETVQQMIGNYVAVGTFSPAIEIWNLDVLDPLEPSATLGGPLDPADESIKKKKKGKKSSLVSGSHTDAVMSLSWNKDFRQALASGSADKTVKIWDVTTQKCNHTFKHHSDKVQSVSWHGQEAYLLASGSFDKTVALLDCRSGVPAAVFQIPSDIEAMAWDPFAPYHLYCTLEDGQLVCIDVRLGAGSSYARTLADGTVSAAKFASPLLSFEAHAKTASCLSFSPKVPGMLATSSIDKTVKVWDVKHIQHQQDIQQDLQTKTKKKDKKVPASSINPPHMVAYKSMNVGKLFSIQYNSDDAFMLATAGDKGMVAVWETDELEAINKYFADRTADSETINSDAGVGNSAIKVSDEDEVEMAIDAGDSATIAEVITKEKKDKKKNKKIHSDK